MAESNGHTKYKLCKDCVNYQYGLLTWLWWGKPICTHVSNVVVHNTINLINGKIQRIIVGNYVTCEKMRQRDGACGTLGNLHEVKK